MTYEEQKQLLVDKVIDEIQKDLAKSDFTVLDELLKFVPIANLIEYLPEEEWKQFESLLNK